jgi:hypothetical protein
MELEASRVSEAGTCTKATGAIDHPDIPEADGV